VLVLQGNVALKLSYGGKFFMLVMRHFFLIPTLKEFKKSTSICQSNSKIKVAQFFLLTVYILQRQVYLGRVDYKPKISSHSH